MNADIERNARYGVVKTYPQRGPMRQYRLTVATSFRCFRCGLPKTSKLVTVFRQDWSHLLCNGCYGRLLSLYEVRAGLADDSTLADALAEQLMAFVSEAELRKAADLLRIRVDGVDQLSERSQRLLATSEFVSRHLANATDLDWSAAVVGICKAVEVEFVERLVVPLARQCRDLDLAEDVRDGDLGRVARFCADCARKPPELGVIRHFLQTAYHSKSRQETSNLLRGLRRTVRMWPDSSWLLEPDGAIVALEHVTVGYRNRAVHTDELRQAEYESCFDLALGERGLMWELLRSTTPR